MDLAARPHITAGVALASAAVLAASPMAQHLPDFHLAQQLRQVSVSNIQLTDAASGLVDLFANVQSELTSLAGSEAAAATVPAEVISSAVNPLQTWVNIVPQTLANIQGIANEWLTIPAPVLQQVLANGIDYASLYVAPFQAAAKSAVTYFTATKGVALTPLLIAAQKAFNSGNMVTGVNNLVAALYSDPIVQIGLPLDKILQIPVYFMQNASNATTYLVNNTIPTVVNFGTAVVPAAFKGLGLSLQNAYNAWGAGDTIGAVTNVLDIPGQMTNGFINGFPNAKGIMNNGLLSSPPGNGTVNVIVTQMQGLAEQIVAPGAQNIMTGGSLGVGFQNLVNQLINGWPSLTPVINELGAGLTQLLQSIPSVLSNLPSILGNFGGALASNIGLLISNLLKLL
ncbi:hypothetical protein H7H82_16885 [Mycobacterium heidelbergense]|uniref:hypothetical protein n=1 Tax=Mycobacterium heidelbergense TaxID=53376 RepID=UPI001151ADE1|nr:hypothetical protein [Mycobacterium heidelbergense]MCV7052250.1 hypothetical protein [Mycobacterium heidelbergense]BBZ51879.1 hypothetical protein MHEI_35960 [Mycobacterium heidelbergense]